MKKILILLLMGFLLGCSPTPIDNYKGGIIVNKIDGITGRRITIRVPVPENTISPHEWRFVRPHVVKYDFERYQLGDTIK